MKAKAQVRVIRDLRWIDGDLGYIVEAWRCVMYRG